MHRLSLTLDILAWIALAVCALGLLTSGLYAWQANGSPQMERLIRRGQLPDPKDPLAWWIWAPVPFALAWLIAGWLR